MKRIEGENGSFLPEEIIPTLESEVTPERLQRIDKVVQGRRQDLAVVLENIYNRGNTHAVMRTMEAFGYFQLHSIQLQEDYKLSIGRVSQGADKWLLERPWQTTENCVESLKKDGYQILVTSLEGGIPIYDADFSRPTALCFGNERDGASKALLENCDQRVYIPMHGFVQSFNISVAAALCLQHIRRSHDTLSSSGLSPEWQKYLKALYLLRGCTNGEPLVLENRRRNPS